MAKYVIEEYLIYVFVFPVTHSWSFLLEDLLFKFWGFRNNILILIVEPDKLFFYFFLFSQYVYFLKSAMKPVSKPSRQQMDLLMIGNYLSEASTMQRFTILWRKSFSICTKHFKIPKEVNLENVSSLISLWLFTICNIIFYLHSYQGASIHGTWIRLCWIRFISRYLF